MAPPEVVDTLYFNLMAKLRSGGLNSPELKKFLYNSPKSLALLNLGAGYSASFAQADIFAKSLAVVNELGVVAKKPSGKKDTTTRLRGRSSVRGEPAKTAIDTTAKAEAQPRSSFKKKAETTTTTFNPLKNAGTNRTSAAVSFKRSDAPDTMAGPGDKHNSFDDPDDDDQTNTDRIAVDFQDEDYL